MTIATNLRSLGQRLDLPTSDPPYLPLPREAQQQLAIVSQSPLTPVLIVAAGEARRVAARALHELSHAPGSGAPFVELDCTLLSDDGAGTELFGLERDASPVRDGAGAGRVALADGGTLFLDHVAALTPGAQARLVRFLDAVAQKRAAQSSDRALELRIVAGCEREPLGALEAGRLRDDLYRALTVFRIDIPPLRSRSADILELARAAVRHFAARLNKPVQGLSPDAENALLGYDFPGNERELRGVIERAIILTQGSELIPADLGLDESRARQVSPEDHFFWVDQNPGGVPPPLDVVDRAYVARVLSHTSGRRLAAAHLLGISYPTFLKRLRELGFDRATQRTSERQRA